MSEHTKGPWTATKHDQHWVRVNVTIKAGGNTWVAFMPDEDKEERMANARLMAAAPELLLALEACYEAMETDNDYDLKIILPDMIKSVIDKAKGQP